jgi:tetratricopeptide (TPR) repeat protein
MQEQLTQPKPRFSLDLDSELGKATTAPDRASHQPQFPLNEASTGVGFFEIRPELVEEVQIQQSPETKARRTDAAVLIANSDLLLKHGESELATHLLRQCLYLNSRHPEALKRLATCLTREKDLQLKAKVHETLVEAEFCFENLAELGHCYYQQKQDKKAQETYIEALRRLTENSKGLFEVYKNLGNISMHEGDFDGAEECYHKAFNLNPDSDVLLVNIGTLGLQREELENSLAKFRQALEINPKNDKAWVGLALVHHAMGDLVLSRANLENALDVNPLNRTALHLASSWAARDLDFGFAIQALQNFVSEVDCDEEMSLLLIHFLCVRNQFAEAQLELERLLLWNPSNQKLLQIEQEIRNAPRK